MPISTQVHLQQLPPYLEAISRSNLERAQHQSRSPFVQYMGQRNARNNADLQRSAQLGRQEQLYMPYLNQAQQLYGQSVQGSPENIQQYLNPYQKHINENIRKEGLRTFNEGILPSLQGQFIGAGQMGSTLHRDMAIQAARQAQEDIGSRQAQSMASGYGHAANMYNADAQRQLEAGKNLADMARQRQAGHLSDITALENQGSRQRGSDQQDLDVGYNNFIRQQEYPWRQMSNLSGVISGTPYSSQEVQHQQSPPPPPVDWWHRGAQLAGLAGQVYAASRLKKGGRVSSRSKKRGIKMKGLSALKEKKYRRGTC